MDAVIAKVGFEGDFAAFLHFLRTDPRFYAKTGEELLINARESFHAASTMKTPVMIEIFRQAAERAHRTVFTRDGDSLNSHWCGGSPGSGRTSAS